MGSEREPDTESSARAESPTTLPPLLREPLKILGGVLLALGGLVTFVAAVGGAIIWVRFYAARLPADQALAAMPRGELVASGAVMLAAFVMLGALAVVGVYMFQRTILEDSPSSPGVVRGLLALVTVEIVIVVALAEGTPEMRRLLAAELVVLFALLILLVIRWRESLIGRKLEPYGKRPRARAVLKAWVERTMQPRPTDDEDENAAPAGTTRSALLLAGLVTIALVLTMVLEVVGGPSEVQAWALSITLLCSVVFIGSRWIATGLPGPPAPAWNQLKNENAATLMLKRITKLTIFGLAFLGIACASLVLREKWLAVSLVAAIALGIASWRIARRADYEFFPCGVAVFVSVPLLGAVAGIARNLDDPQVQPVALIRTFDGETEALQGIYVTETDERVYLGTVATNGCTGEIQRGSGRMLWVPRKEVAAMLLGPPQSVQDAGTRALEMYYALAPAAANPYASGGRPRTAAGVPARSTRVPKRQRRLEDLGPALRRDFNLEPEVIPPSVKEGELAQLSRPTRDRAEDQTLRVNGAKVADTGDGKLDWKDGRLQFTVPEGASSGLVTVECGNLATEPILRVRRTPRARVALTLDAGTEEIVLDGSRSTDDGGRIVAWRWSFDGRRSDSRRILRRTPELDDGLYEVGLRAIDDEGDSDAVSVWIGQLPLPRQPVESETTLAAIADGTLARLRSEIRAGGTLVLHGHTGRRVWDDEAVRGEVEAAEAQLRGMLAPGDRHRRWRSSIEMRTLVLGAGCPPLVRAGSPRATPRIDLFFLGRGARVQLPAGCEPQEL